MSQRTKQNKGTKKARKLGAKQRVGNFWQVVQGSKRKHWKLRKVTHQFNMAAESIQAIISKAYIEYVLNRLVKK